MECRSGISIITSWWVFFCLRRREVGITFITDPEEPKKPSNGLKGVQKPKKNNQRKAAPSGMSLDGPGRLRIRHLQTLFSVSHTTVYAMIKRGEIPPPDGRDSSWRVSNPGRPYWFTSTIRPLVEPTPNPGLTDSTSPSSPPSVH